MRLSSNSDLFQDDPASFRFSFTQRLYAASMLQIPVENMLIFVCCLIHIRIIVKPTLFNLKESIALESCKKVKLEFRLKPRFSFILRILLSVSLNQH